MSQRLYLLRCGSFFISTVHGYIPPILPAYRVRYYLALLSTSKTTTTASTMVTAHLPTTPPPPPRPLPRRTVVTWSSPLLITVSFIIISFFSRPDRVLRLLVLIFIILPFIHHRPRPSREAAPSPSPSPRHRAPALNPVFSSGVHTLGRDGVFLAGYSPV